MATPRAVGDCRLAEPFDNVFNLDGRKATVAVNHGLAALVYALVGGLIVRLLRC